MTLGTTSAATAATAVLTVTLVKEHGLQYLLATTVLAGVLQIGMGLLKLGHFMQFVSRPDDENALPSTSASASL